MANASLQGCTGSVRETMDDSRKTWRVSKNASGIENPFAGVAYGSGRTTENVADFENPLRELLRSGRATENVKPLLIIFYNANLLANKASN